MKAVVMHDFDTVPSLSEVATPQPGATGLLIRVLASSVNPADAAIAAGMLKGMADYEFPVTLGRDFAGVVEAVGSDVTRHRPGDHVFGFVMHANPGVRDGSWAEHLVVSETSVGRKPDGVEVAAAGAAPLAAITALAAFDALDPSNGATVLVLGASGGVGSFFVQLAAGAGALVIAPGLPEDRDYLLGLGATSVPDRDDEPAAYLRERHPDGVDALLDLVSFTPDLSLLKPSGRLASPLGAADEGPGRTNLMAFPTAANLERLGDLLGTGALTVPIRKSYPLGHAVAALDALATTHTQGKIALELKSGGIAA
jgi:NADPH:quinone reductase-like Zn-dependent oxidoreductase